MEKKSFINRHTGAISVVSVIVWFAVIAIIAVFSSCKGSQEYVEIVKWDTLHVYHTDTIREVHNDTIREKVVVTVHDSIIKQTIITRVVDENGNVVHSEKETNNEVWHNSETNSQLIQHTVDSLLQAKMDSIYNASHEDKPVLVEKKENFFVKLWRKIQVPFTIIGLVAVVMFVLWLVMKMKR